MLPISMTFVAGRFDPPLEALDEVQALWRIPYFPRAGMTFTYQVRASAPGLFDVPAWSALSFVDLRHRTDTFLPPPAQLRVLSGFIDPLP